MSDNVIEFPGGSEDCELQFIPLRRISVSFGRTINLGNYESAKIQVGYETDLQEDANHDEEYNKAWEIVMEQVEKVEKEIAG